MSMVHPPCMNCIKQQTHCMLSFLRDVFVVLKFLKLTAEQDEDVSSLFSQVNYTSTSRKRRTR